MKITKYALAAMAFGALTACQNDDAPELNDYFNDPEAVLVNASIGGLQSRANTDGDGSQWTAGDAIHVINVTEGAVAGKDEATYTYNTDNGFVPDEKYIVWVDGKNSFKAYYPCHSSATASYEAFILPLDQSGNTPGQEGYIGYADWMTATASSEKTIDHSISLGFTHQLARVTVKITGYKNQYGSTLPEVSNPIFSVPGVNRDSRVTVAAEAEVKGLMLADKSASKLHSFMAVLPAGKYREGSVLMTLNVGGQKLTIRPSSYLVTTGLEAGTSYNVNLTVGKNTASISGITVADWNEGWNENGTANEMGANVEGNTITTSFPGQLTDKLLDAATTSDLTFTIKGSDLNADDFAVLSAWLNKQYQEDDTRLYNMNLVDVAELPSKAFNECRGIGTLKAPNVSKINQYAFLIQAKEIWLTKAGAIEVANSWMRLGDTSSGNECTVYLNVDKRVDGTGSPTVSTWQNQYVGTFFGWVGFGYLESINGKDYFKFVDEAGNITDWDGNPITN